MVACDAPGVLEYNSWVEVPPVIESKKDGREKGNHMMMMMMIIFGMGRGGFVFGGGNGSDEIVVGEWR